MKVRVYYEDTDIGGIVYHSKYLNFCERARSELLFSKNIEVFNSQTNSGFVVKRINANFIKSATLGDILEVKTKLKEYSKVTLTLIQSIFKDTQKIFEMEVVLVYLNSGKPSRIDNKLIEMFATI